MASKQKNRRVKQPKENVYFDSMLNQKLRVFFEFSPVNIWSFSSKLGLVPGEFLKKFMIMQKRTSAKRE
jgi:hypothetical protein